MNIIEYLVHHTVASEKRAERLWMSRSVTDTRGHLTLDREVEGPVRIFGVPVQELGTGRPLEEHEVRSYLSSTDISRGVAYVFEPWITEEMDLRKYEREPNFVVFDNARLHTPWRRIGTINTTPLEEATIETSGRARFYTASDEGPIHLARVSFCDGAHYSVRKHNLFGALEPKNRYA